MKRLIIVFALLLLPAAAVGQSYYDANKSCTIQAGDLQASAGRACWRLEASITTFSEIADGLLVHYPESGGNYTLRCDKCMVDELGVAGCTQENDVVVRGKIAAAQIRGACVLLGFRRSKLRSDNVTAAEATPIPAGDFGGDAN